MNIEFQLPKNQSSIIKVIGVGGGGGNAVNNMFNKGIRGVDFVVCNTDLQALEMSSVPNKIRLGAGQTEGLGAGANPEVGKGSALESIEEIREILSKNTKMVFVTAGMGGGTGTGAAPVIAGLAKEMGILTVAIVTTPFKFEGRKRNNQALAGIAELEKNVDTLLVINNDNLTHFFGQDVTMKRAFEDADTVLCDAAKGIAEIITQEGYINVDFADVKTIMKDGGTALMGSAVYSGEDRAIRAVEEAISSPLLDNVSIHGSKGILVNISASEQSLRLDETTTVIEYVQEAAGDNADIIFGTVYNNDLEDRLCVTVIATGFNQDKGIEEMPNVQDNLVVEEKKEESPREELTISFEEMFSFEDKSTEKNKEDAMFEVRKETEDEKDEKLREERMEKLKQKEYDIHNNDSLKNLEDTPAYLRRQVALEDAKDDTDKGLSRTSLDEIIENKYELNENNSFLHDNVD